MLRRRTAWLALPLVLLLALTTAAAQELTTGTIAGKVTDPTGRPIAGASIITTSQFGTRTAETDASGNYVVPFLRPATYTVRVEASGGFTTVIQSDVVVSLNARTTSNFTLEPGTTETITVTGRSPLVDPQSTSTQTNLKYDEFANSVPLGRSFTDTYAVAPGVVPGLGTGDGNSSIGGASGLENAYLIDGVNVTNTGFGGIGSYNIVYGSLGTGVTSEFLDEVQVKTGGFEAEYGQALGGIVNTVVKSGTNDLKGSVAWYGKFAGLESSRELADLSTGNTSIVAQDVQDFAFSYSGPIRKDKLFFFFALNPVFTTHDLRAQDVANPAFQASSTCTGGSQCESVFNETLSTNAFAAATAQAFPAGGRDIPRDRTAFNYALKFSWMASPKHEVEFSFFGDPAEGAKGPQRGSAIRNTIFDTGGGQSEIKYGSHNQAVKWNAVFTPRFFMEAQVARHDGKFRETSVLNEHQYVDLRNTQEFIRGATAYDPGTGPVPFTLNPIAPQTGGVGFITNQDDESLQLSLKFTNIFTRHEIKYGAQYDDISYLEAPSYTGPSFDVQLPVSDPLTGAPVDADLNGIQDTILVPTTGGGTVEVRNGAGSDPTVAYDSANAFRVTRARLGPELPPTSAQELNLFAQDTWQMTPRLTLKAGLRYTSEEMEGVGSFSMPFGTQVLSFGPFTQRIFTAGTTTFTPSGYSFDGNWAPRIGVSWDVVGNGKSRLYAHYGRYYERVPNDLAVRAFSNEIGLSFQEFDDRALTTPRVLGTTTCDDGGGGSTACDMLFPVFMQGLDQTTVVAGTKLPYEDELSAGFAFETSPNSSVEVRAIFRSQGRVLEDVQVNAAEQVLNFYYGYAYGYPYDPFGGSLSTPASTTFPGMPFGTYQLANPGTKAVPAGGTYGFPNPEREYKALEFVYTKRFSENWSLFANYRYARLKGNYEGLFRNDNGQSDPNLSSVYDFPDTPLMAGQFTSGVLPTDATHVLRVYPSYTFRNKLRVGANFSWSSGVPRTSLLAHPVYQNSGEIPGIDPVYAYWIDPDLNGSPDALQTTNDLSDALTDPEAFSGRVFLYSYTPVKRGNLGRTPGVATLDLHADYPIQFGKSRLSLMIDVFNFFGTQEPTGYIDTVEFAAGVTDPDFLKPAAFQAPRSWRLAARWDF